MTSNSTPAMAYFSTQFETMTTEEGNTTHSAEVMLLISVFGGICSLVTVVGNLIVILSFIINQSLRNFSNYMILSLALSDLTIGGFSMNVFTIYNVHNKWTLGQAMCKAWLSVDYTASNASVMNLLVICVDRYIAITKPIKYKRWCSPKNAAIAIAAVWAISFLMWVPAITLWDVISENTTFPEGQCYIPFINQNPFLSVITIVGAFYLPALIMCALYQRVIQKIKYGRRKLGTMIQDATVVMACRENTKSKLQKKACKDTQSLDGHLNAGTSTSTNAMTVHVSETINAKEKLLCVEEENFANDEETINKQESLAELNGISSGISTGVKSRLFLQDSSNKEDNLSDSGIVNNGSSSTFKSNAVNLHRANSLLISKAPAPTHSQYIMKSQSISYVTPTKNNKEVLTKKITTVRESQRAIRERRVTVLLKFILLCFMLLWIPYSLIVVIAAVCYECTVPTWLWNLSYWLCYLNSTVNPFCYGFCNENFRRTFKAIMTTRWWTKESRKTLQLGRKPAAFKISKNRNNNCPK